MESGGVTCVPDFGAVGPILAMALLSIFLFIPHPSLFPTPHSEKPEPLDNRIGAIYIE